MGEDVLVQTGNEVKLGCCEHEARLLQLNGDGHLTRAGVHWEMGDLERSKRGDQCNIMRTGWIIFNSALLRCAKETKKH